MSTKYVGIRMPKDLIIRLENYQARSHYVSMSQSIITLISLGLEHPEAGDFRVSKKRLAEIKKLMEESDNGTDIRKSI